MYFNSTRIHVLLVRIKEKGTYLIRKFDEKYWRIVWFIKFVKVFLASYFLLYGKVKQINCTYLWWFFSCQMMNKKKCPHAVKCKYNGKFCQNLQKTSSAEKDISVRKHCRMLIQNKLTYSFSLNYHIHFFEILFAKNFVVNAV